MVCRQGNGRAVGAVRFVWGGSFVDGFICCLWLSNIVCILIAQWESALRSSSPAELARPLPPLLMCCGTEKTNFIRCCSSREQLPRLSPALRPAATPYPAFLDPGHAKDLSRISDFNDGVDADAGSGERKTWRLPPEPATRPTCQVLQPSAMQLQATGNITKTE